MQVRELAVKYERVEAAAHLEAGGATEELQAQLDAAELAQQQLQQQLVLKEQQTEGRLAAAAEALTAATAEIEHLSAQLLQMQQLLQQRRAEEVRSACVAGAGHWSLFMLCSLQLCYMGVTTPPGSSWQITRTYLLVLGATLSRSMHHLLPTGAQ